MSNNVVKLEETRNALDNSPAPMSPSAMMLDMETLKAISHVADLMAEGKVSIPVHLRGNRGDCFAIAMQSAQWGMNPFAVAQKTHLSQSGALGYEAQLINAVVCNLAPIKGRPEYEFLGDWDKILGKVEERKSDKGGKYYVATYTKADESGLGVIVRATFRGESEPREVRVMMSQAYPRFSTQWATDPQQQISYLAIRKWARRYTPDVLLGVYTGEELDARNHEPRDMGRADEVPQSGASRTESVRNKLASKRATPAPAAMPNLDKILRDIDAATTAHELAKAIEPAANLASDDDKEKVRAAYQNKVKTERERAAREAASQQAQNPTDNGEPPAITYDDLVARFNATNDVDVLDADATLVGQLPVDQQQDAIAVYNDRREILLGA